MATNKSLGIATSANWKTICLAWRTIRPPILKAKLPMQMVEQLSSCVIVVEGGFENLPTNSLTRLDINVR
jgi:hypothetical protein